MSTPCYIAQNLNSSDPAVAAAIAAGDAAWLRACARRIAESGVDFIDCNAGTFGRDEATLLAWVVQQIGPVASVPLSLDSADPQVLARVAARMAPPVLINSVALDTPWSDGLEAVLVGTGNPVVLSLRRDRSLPRDASERLRWAESGVRELVRRGVAQEDILVDAIALPWGDDVEAGRPMLDFVAAWAKRGVGRGALVGLGNLGHRHPDSVRIHREWMGRLRNLGVAAVILDAFDPALREDPSAGG